MNTFYVVVWFLYGHPVRVIFKAPEAACLAAVEGPDRIFKCEGAGTGITCENVSCKAAPEKTDKEKKK